MKKIKPYSVFNESLRDKLKGQDREEILKKIKNMNQDELNKTLLQMVYKQGYEDLVKVIIENGADVNYENGTIIRQYAYKRNDEMVEYLLDKGAHIHNLLSMYAEDNNTKMINKLIERGADVNYDDDYLFRQMVKHSNIDMIEYLLDDYDIDIETTYSYPLRHAASVGDYDIVKLLLEHGANPYCEDGDAIEMAEDNGYDNVVEILKEYINKNNE